MSLVYDIFYIVIFVSIIGSIFSLMSIFVKKTIHVILPLCLVIFGMVFFLLPIIAPTLWLISPEQTVYAYGYQIACHVWLLGCLAFALIYIARALLAFVAIKKCRICMDENINRIFFGCISRIGFNQVLLYYGSLDEPACVITLMRPAVIVNEMIIKQLSVKEL